VRNTSHDPASAERRVDGLLHLALAAAVVLLATSMVRLTVTRFGYEPTLNGLHTARSAEAAADGAMLDMETGVRGYQLSADHQLLEPYLTGQSAFAAAAATAHTRLSDLPDAASQWATAVSLAMTWQQHYATQAIALVRPSGPTATTSSLVAGMAEFDSYRHAQAVASTTLSTAIARQRSAEDLFRTATGLTQGVALVLLMFGLLRRQRGSHETRPTTAFARTPGMAPWQGGFATAGDIDALALSIASAGREISGALAACLWLAEADGELRRVDPGHPVIAAQRRRHDVALRAHREGAITTSVSRSRRVVAVPLLHEGKTLGVVELDLPSGSNEPSHAQIEMLRAWGRQAAKAIAHGPGSTDRDRLTGFNGQPTLLDDLTTAVDTAMGEDRPVSLVLLEIDHLDRIPAAGTVIRDDLIRTVGAVLADTVRTSDTAYRTGEGSFAVLLPGTPLGAATSLAERLRQIIARRFVERGLTASFGVATCPDAAQDEDGLLEAASAALYDAQRFGGNRAQPARALADELALVRRRATELN
jgi:diguanylate cyclase (GGDEF)-like protein